MPVVGGEGMFGGAPRHALLCRQRGQCAHRGMRRLPVLGSDCRRHIARFPLVSASDVIMWQMLLTRRRI